MDKLKEFQKNLNIFFKDESLLQQAFVHRSYLNEHPDFTLGHNERLEFLGDAVVELIVTDYLYKNYEESEGKLTSWRAALVNSTMMSQVAERLRMNDVMLLSRGEAKDSERARQYILANAFEAFVGALYLDQGYEACRLFIAQHLLPELPHILAERKYVDAKSYFQEMAQEEVGVTPHYKVINEWGPDHARHFNIGVFLGKDLIEEGEGLSKQEAEQKAAEKALIKMGWNGHDGSEKK